MILKGGKPTPGKFNEPVLEEYIWECKKISKEYGWEYETSETFKNVTQLQLAILEKDTEAVKANLEKGCDVNFDKTLRGRDPMTPLIMACAFSSLPIVSMLLDHPDIDIDKRPYDEGENALSWAVRNPKNLDMVKHLVESGADIYLRDRLGFSHLHRAVEAGALDIVEYLYSLGASTTYTAGDESPLLSAVSQKICPWYAF